jgi:mutual gliding-motility protein MglA
VRIGRGIATDPQGNVVVVGSLATELGGGMSMITGGMSFIDEAAKEINVKIVWYSAAPGTAAAVVRLIAARTRPDLKHEQTLQIGDGLSLVHLQFVPAGLGKLRGFSTRFHLYAVEPESGAVEPDDARLLIFRGADAHVFIGGDGDAAALARVDAAIAAEGYANVPIVFAVEANDAIAQGRALGFPDADCFALDAKSGAGVFEAFKLVAKKVLALLAGHKVTSRPTPALGTVALAVDPTAPPLTKTIEETQVGLDAWQREYHAKAIWILGLEETRFTPPDLPENIPAHIIHVIRATSIGAFVVMSDGFSRDAISRLELRTDTSQYGWQIAMTVSFLGRLAYRQANVGQAPWRAFDLVTTAEEPIFGLSHFVLAPAGSVHVGGEAVTILRAVPITPAEHYDVSSRQLTGDHMGAWLAERSATMLDRWASALAHDKPFGAV